MEAVLGLWLFLQGQWETLEVSEMKWDMTCLVLPQDHSDVCVENRLRPARYPCCVTNDHKLSHWKQPKLIVSVS